MAGRKRFEDDKYAYRLFLTNLLESPKFDNESCLRQLERAYKVTYKMIKPLKPSTIKRLNYFIKVNKKKILEDLETLRTTPNETILPPKRKEPDYSQEDRRQRYEDVCARRRIDEDFYKVANMRKTIVGPSPSQVFPPKNKRHTIDGSSIKKYYYGDSVKTNVSKPEADMIPVVLLDYDDKLNKIAKSYKQQIDDEEVEDEELSGNTNCQRYDRAFERNIENNDENDNNMHEHNLEFEQSNLEQNGNENIVSGLIKEEIDVSDCELRIENVRQLLDLSRPRYGCEDDNSIGTGSSHAAACSNNYICNNNTCNALSQNIPNSTYVKKNLKISGVKSMQKGIQPTVSKDCPYFHENSKTFNNSQGVFNQIPYKTFTQNSIVPDQYISMSPNQQFYIQNMMSVLSEEISKMQNKLSILTYQFTNLQDILYLTSTPYIPSNLEAQSFTKGQSKSTNQPQLKPNSNFLSSSNVATHTRPHYSPDPIFQCYLNAPVYQSHLNSLVEPCFMAQPAPETNAQQSSITSHETPLNLSVFNTE